MSGIAQDALSAVLAARATDYWLDEVARLQPTGATHEQVLRAVTDAWEELGPSLGG